MEIPFFKKKKEIHWPLAISILVVFILLMVVLHLAHPITLAELRSKYAMLVTLETQQPLLFTILLFAVYVISIFFTLPDSTLLSILAGTTYSFPLAVLFISFSETVGAFGSFCLIRYVFKQYYKKKSTEVIRSKLGIMYAKNELSYLLFFRFSHILPFWVVNLLAAGLKTHPLKFLWTTFIGTLPLSCILAKAGGHFKKTLMSNEPFSMANILDTHTELLLLALGLLALLPIAIKKYYKTK
ncbi:MAG: VTT domain-containing protein [Chlamydiae bacterium]|nr:VTT domain-containing protein [Chlamydiota bacterium]